jgi:hypothetical protein
MSGVDDGGPDPTNAGPVLPDTGAERKETK